MNYNLTLKGHFENLTSGQGHGLIRNGYLWSCIGISWSRWSSWTQLWCLHCSSWYLSKVIAEKLLVTFHDLKWSWRHDEGSLVSIFRIRVWSLPVTRCLSVSSGFLPKEALFVSIPLTYNGEVVILIWPWVKDIQIPRYTFYRYWYGYQLLIV